MVKYGSTITLPDEIYKRLKKAKEHWSYESWKRLFEDLLNLCNHANKTSF